MGNWLPSKGPSSLVLNFIGWKSGEGKILGPYYKVMVQTCVKFNFY